MKQVVYNEHARTHLMDGVNAVANTVKVTLGPRGRNVMLDRDSTPLITNDGVTIVNEIVVENKFEQMGVKLVQEVANKTQELAGDGTTTATILAQTMIDQGLHAQYTNVHDVIWGMQQAVRQAVAYITTHSVQPDNIEKVATVAANDESLGHLVAKAVSMAGRTGTISVQAADNTNVESVPGIQLREGYMSPAMVTNHASMTCEHDNMLCLVIDHIHSLQEIMQMLEKAGQQPLLIITKHVNDAALSAIVMNILRGTLNVCIVTAPGFGDAQDRIMQDITVASGCTGQTLGRFSKVIVKQDNTTLIGGAGDVAVHVERLRAQASTAAGYEKQDLLDRIARLTNGVTIVNVYGKTKTEVEEKKMRIHDAIHATKAAMEHGVVTGGGVTLYHASEQITTSTFNDDQKVGAQIVQRALKVPLTQLAINAGVTPRIPKANVALNAKTGNMEDLMQSGVIDPAHVVRSTIESAVSITCMILSTSVLITNQ